ncbi:MAG: PQQ-binding-like beta-propeller repeat protein, partial [Ktedonobacterales bacterium]
MPHTPPNRHTARQIWPRPGLLLALLTLLLAACASGPAAQRPPATQPTATPAASLDAQLAQESLYVTTTIGQTVSNPGFLEALNAQTGASRWKFSTNGSIGVPVVANGTVYIAPDDGSVRAVNSTTGKQVWSFARTVGVSTRTGFDGYPAIANGVLYVCTDGGAVYALDATTGKQRWLFTAPGDAGDHIYAAPAVANGLVFVAPGGPNAMLYALNASTGAVRWSYQASGALSGVPIVVNGTVYV